MKLLFYRKDKGMCRQLTFLYRFPVPVRRFETLSPFSFVYLDTIVSTKEKFILESFGTYLSWRRIILPGPQTDCRSPLYPYTILPA